MREDDRLRPRAPSLPTRLWPPLAPQPGRRPRRGSRRTLVGPLAGCSGREPPPPRQSGIGRVRLEPRRSGTCSRAGQSLPTSSGGSWCQPQGDARHPMLPLDLGPLPGLAAFWVSAIFFTDSASDAASSPDRSAARSVGANLGSGEVFFGFKPLVTGMVNSVSEFEKMAPPADHVRRKKAHAEQMDGLQ